MPVEIRYRLKDEPKYHTCFITYWQYLNFKRLPVIEECEIINKDRVPRQILLSEIEEALYRACKEEHRLIKELTCPEKYI